MATTSGDLRYPPLRALPGEQHQGEFTTGEPGEQQFFKPPTKQIEEE